MLTVVGAMCLFQANGITLGNPHCLVYFQEDGKNHWQLDPKEPGKPFALVWADGEDRAAIPLLDDNGNNIVPVVTTGTADASWLEVPQVWREKDFKDDPNARFFFEDDPEALSAVEACSAVDRCREHFPDRRWIVVKIKETGACKNPSTFKVGIQGSDETRDFYVVPGKWSWEKAKKWIENNVEVLPGWQKARTIDGIAFGGSDSPFQSGTITVKCGKANNKGYAKVSVTISPFDGKKISYKAISVDVSKASNPDGQVWCLWPDSKYQDTETIYIWEDQNGETFFCGEFLGGTIGAESATLGGDFDGTHTMYLPKWFTDLGPDAVLPGSEAALADAAGILDLYRRGFCSQGIKYIMDFTAAGSKWNFSADDTLGTPAIKISYKKNNGLVSGSAKIEYNNLCMANPSGERQKKLSLKIKGVVYRTWYGDTQTFIGAITYRKSFSTPFEELGPTCQPCPGGVCCTGALDSPVSQ